MSAHWAMLQLSMSYQERTRHARIQEGYEEEIASLRSENRVLREQLAEAQARLKQKHQLKFKPGKKKKKKNSNHKATDKLKPRKRGAPAGHPPWQREKPTRIDRSVHVPAPEICPHCAHKNLSPFDQNHIQLQEDIVLQPRTVVTEYVHDQSYCPNCRRAVFQTAPDELRNCSIGPITKAVAVYLRHEVKLSYRDIQKVFSGLFGMPFVPASAMAFSHRIADLGQVLYQDIREKVRVADVVHADETFWRIDGSSAYIWYGGNPQIGFFHASPSRSSDNAVSIFGSNFQGHLVTDSYAGYNAVNPESRQVCLAHLKRKAKEILDCIALMPKKQQDRKSRTFCKALIKLIAECCRLYHKREADQISFSKAKKQITKLERKIEHISRFSLKNKEAENLRKRITDPKRDALKLFAFLKVPGMPPTNNHAEQSLRLPVIIRKITNGSRSLEGAQALATNLSLLVTAKRQNKDPVELFLNVLLQGKDTPAKFIYDQNTPAHDTS